MVVVGVVVVGVVVVVVVVVGVGGGGWTTGGAITAVWSDIAVPVPFLFVAVTRIRSVNPASAVEATCVVAVALAMSAQPAPAPSQRSHWNAYVLPGPDQTPGDDVSVDPTVGEPDIDGAAVFDGSCFPGGFGFAAVAAATG